MVLLDTLHVEKSGQNILLRKYKCITTKKLSHRMKVPFIFRYDLHIFFLVDESTRNVLLRLKVLRFYYSEDTQCRIAMYHKNSSTQKPNIILFVQFGGEEVCF